MCFGPDTLAEARNRGYTLATPGKRRRHRRPPLLTLRGAP